MLSGDRNVDVEAIRDLTENVSDYTATSLRLLASAAGPVGTVIAEVFTTAIGRQRNEQLRDFLLQLSARVNDLRIDLGALRNDPERVELHAQGAEAAARAAWEDRRRYLAELVARGIGTAELEADEARKLLHLLNALTDAEIVTLIYYATEPTLGHTSEFYKRHERVLRPASREIMDMDEQDEPRRAALQDGYSRNLERLGLVDAGAVPGPGSIRVSPLGKLLLRYIGIEDPRSIA